MKKLTREQRHRIAGRLQQLVETLRDVMAQVEAILREVEGDDPPSDSARCKPVAPPRTPRLV